ncbi:alpha/beta fold hydrolase [Ilumatobacter nonamiensis]|uniref:alpha/beta fold hydrolase n=1 Tax=Ilumatobacter nonamiensis TaxID=467093 RepID=UPI000686A959|nr:alpha/beta hydrolase [Ilumatobacter nonamiensis]
MVSRSINETMLDVAEAGGGDPVVLVHGSASDARTWTGQIEPLAERFRVVTYSRRSHWPNEPAPDGATYSMSEHVEDLAALVRSLDIGPAHVVGHSYGGVVALTTAIRHPSLVRSLVLIEPPVIALFLSEPPKPSEMLRVVTRSPALALALVRFGATGVAPAKKAAKQNDMDHAIRKFGTAVLGAQSFANLGDDRWQQILDNNIRAEYLSEIFDPMTETEVRSVQSSTLLVSGADSPRLWRLLTDHLDSLMAHSSRVEIPGASHIVHEDNTAAFNRHLVEFLTDAAR